MKKKKASKDKKYSDRQTTGDLILQSTAGTLGEAEFIEGAADVNGDGKVNSSDAVLILQLTAGTITEFPV